MVMFETFTSAPTARSVPAHSLACYDIQGSRLLSHSTQVNEYVFEPWWSGGWAGEEVEECGVAGKVATSWLLVRCNCVCEQGSDDEKLSNVVHETWLRNSRVCAQSEIWVPGSHSDRLFLWRPGRALRCKL